MIKTKDRHVTFHVSVNEDEKKRDHVYIVIPKDLWKTGGLVEAIKNAVELAFFDEKGKVEN